MLRAQICHFSYWEVCKPNLRWLSRSNWTLEMEWPGGESPHHLRGESFDIQYYWTCSFNTSQILLAMTNCKGTSWNLICSHLHSLSMFWLKLLKNQNRHLITSMVHHFSQSGVNIWSEYSFASDFQLTARTAPFLMRSAFSFHDNKTS